MIASRQPVERLLTIGVRRALHERKRQAQREEDLRAMTSRWKGKGTALGLGVIAVAAVAVAFVTAGGAGAEQQSALALPRAETLYMSGNQYSPNNDLNPAKNWDYIT